MSEDEKQRTLLDILQYANQNPESFRYDIASVRFDSELAPLPIVLEALAKDAENWSAFFVDTLQAIFKAAKQSDEPQKILDNLNEFAYIEKEEKPFVQEIVDILQKEANSEHMESRLAAIWLLPPFIKNNAVRNKTTVTSSLRQMLQDKSWKVRYVTYQSLMYEDLLLPGNKLSLLDRGRTLLFGKPPMY